MSASALAVPLWLTSSVYVIVNVTCDAGTVAGYTEYVDWTEIVPPGVMCDDVCVLKLPSALAPFEKRKCCVIGVAPTRPPDSCSWYVRRYSNPGWGVVVSGSTVAVRPTMTIAARLIVVVPGEVGSGPGDPHAIAAPIAAMAHTRA